MILNTLYNPGEEVESLIQLVKECHMEFATFVKQLGYNSLHWHSLMWVQHLWRVYTEVYTHTTATNIIFQFIFSLQKFKGLVGRISINI